MDTFTNRMRAEARRAAGAFSHDRAGIVTSYDPTAYKAKVIILPEGTVPNANGSNIQAPGTDADPESGACADEAGAPDFYRRAH